MRIAISIWAELDAEAQARLLERPAQQLDVDIRERVQAILDRVRRDGDAALRALTLDLDGANLEDLAVDDAERERAGEAIGGAALAAIELAIDNVRHFHEAQRPAPVAVETMPGVRCERVTQPLDAVGLYVPAGTAPLPSAAIMLAVPAAIAGCPTRVLCTPPRPDGTADPAVIVAATRAGVDRIFMIPNATRLRVVSWRVAYPLIHRDRCSWLATGQTLQVHAPHLQ